MHPSVSQSPLQSLPAISLPAVWSLLQPVASMWSSLSLSLGSPQKATDCHAIWATSNKISMGLVRGTSHWKPRETDSTAFDFFLIFKRRFSGFFVAPFACCQFFSYFGDFLFPAPAPAYYLCYLGASQHLHNALIIKCNCFAAGGYKDPSIWFSFFLWIFLARN